MFLIGNHNFHKYHSSGLVVLSSSPTDRINSKQKRSDITEDEAQKRIDNHDFWMDRKHEIEEWE